MEKLTGQISNRKPYTVLVTGYDVRVCENIVQLENGEYKYDITIYTKAEYKEIEEQLANKKENRISSLEKENNELKNNIYNLNGDNELLKGCVIEMASIIYS